MMRQLPRMFGLVRAPLSARPAGMRYVRYFAADAKADSAEGAAAKEGASNEEGAPASDAAASDKEASNQKSEWQQKFETKDKECARLKEAYQRSIADFRTLQQTTKQDIQREKQFALQKFAKDLIESVDNFDLAVRALPVETLESSSKDVREFYNGITMVQSVLEKTLAKHGITKMNPLNEKFDPNQHEALFQIPQEGKEPGTIIHVDRTGFKLHDRVLRAPKVGVVKDPSA